MPNPYQAYWCEENIWQLASRQASAAGERLVIVLTGAGGGEVACWQQRAGRADQPLLWDYHVVLAACDGTAWRIWDLDSCLGCPVPAAAWLSATFPSSQLVEPSFQPRFAMFLAATWLSTFDSDRSHMRLADGSWQQPPPPWPAIRGGGLTLSEAVEQARGGCDLATMRRRLLEV